MKRYILIFVLYCVSILSVQAQNEVLIPIVNHKIFALDSRGSTFFTGSHTTVLELDLPVNTVRWYYRFYNVTKKELLTKYASPTSLEDELEKKINDPAYSTIKLPAIPTEYKNKISVYILNDSSQIEVFNKQLTFTKVEYETQSSMLNMYAGWSEVCDPGFISGKQYLGILNQANLTGTNVVLDVVAICKQRTVDAGWSEEVLKDIEVKFVDGYADKLSPFAVEKVTECYIKSLQYEMTYEAYKNQNTAAKKLFENKALENCYNENFKETETDTLTELDVYYLFGNWKTEKDETLDMKFSSELTLKKNNGTVLKGNWYISDNALYLKFENYKTQKYQPIILSPNKYVWKNYETGNYLRYTRRKSETKP